MTNGLLRKLRFFSQLLPFIFLSACISGDDSEPLSNEPVLVDPVQIDPEPPSPTGDPVVPVITDNPVTPDAPVTPGTPETPVNPPDDSTGPPLQPSTLSQVIPKPRPRNAYESLRLTRRQLGGDSKDFALVKFASLFGRLDGIEAIEDDGTLPVEGTGALLSLDLYWDELSLELQTQVAQYVSSANASDLSQSTSGLLDTNEILTMAEQYTTRFQMLTGSALTTPIAFFETPLASAESDNSSNTISAIYGVPSTIGKKITGILNQTNNVFEDAAFSQCNIFITPRYAEFSTARKTTVLAHEIFHCFQNDWLGHDVDRMENTPEWVMEGTAAWAGEFIAGGSGAVDSWWTAYEVNGFKLGLSAYSAIGFWSFIAENIDLWPAVQSFIQGNGAFGSRFSQVTHFLTDQVIDSWPSGPIQRADWGIDWTTESPGYTPTRIPRVFTVSVDNSPFTLRVARGETGTFQLDLDKPEAAALFSVHASAAGNRHWDNGGSTLSLASTSELPIAYCSNGPCICANGRAPAGFASVQDIPNDSRMLTVAMTRSPNTLEGSFSAGFISLEDACSN